MYHAYVRAQVRRLFRAVNNGNAEPVLRLFAERFEHCFPGDHALGGRRTTLAATRLWYARLFRLLPDIQFELRDIWVGGGPWNTIVVIEWNEENSGTDGIRTTNHGIHAMHLKWGRATRLQIWPDTVPLKATLDRLAAAGNVEAHATPIAD